MSRLRTKLRFLFLGLILSLGATGCATAQGYPDDTYGDRGSYQTFYDELSPYGQWVSDPSYGYVWVPDAGDDFRPYYSNGYWVNTEYGNTWYSEYPWGWAPFHYGRWTYSPYYGWIWIPGNVWGPAWVSWRSGGGCYGWAPLGPGISISMSFGSGYYVPDYWWVFTPQQYILNPRFRNYTYGPRYNPRYVQQTTIINNTYVYNHNTYISGPRRGDMERAIGRNITPVSIQNSGRPMGAQLRGNNLNMFRPTIAESSPRVTERPSNFEAARGPISASDSRNRAMVNDRSNTLQQQGPARQEMQSGLSNQPQQIRPTEPARERPRLDPVMQVPQQQQPAQRGNDWNSPARQEAPIQPQRQNFDRGNSNPNPPQQIQRPQRMEAPSNGPSFDRMPDMQRPQRTESPRPAPSFERPQRMDNPRPERMERAEPRGNNASPFRR